MNILLDEIITTPNSTLSLVYIDCKTFCFSIEDGYRAKKEYGQTRIPGGRYQIVKRTTGRIFQKYRKKFGHQFGLELKDVPGFKWILIHIGNTRKDTEGCILVNRCARFQENGDVVGYESTIAYKMLYDIVKSEFDHGKEVWIDINRKIIDLKNQGV